MTRLRLCFAASLLLLFAGVSAIIAADNSTLPVDGGLTEIFANKDIGGVKFPKHIPYNSSGTEIFTSGAPGHVQIRDAAGNARGANVNSSNQLSVSVDGGSVFNANGQTTMANSSPTTMASDQRVSTANASVKIDASTATTAELVALSSGLKIYVTAWDVIAGGTGNIKLVYGTGTNCGTGTTDLTGNYNLTAQAGIAKGAGVGAVLVVPASNALCVTTSAAVQMSGSVAYQQF